MTGAITAYMGGDDKRLPEAERDYALAQLEQSLKIEAELRAEIERLRKVEAAAIRMVNAQHAGPITDEMFAAWRDARALLSVTRDDK